MRPITRANPVSKMVAYQLTRAQLAKCRRCAIEVSEKRARWSKGRGSKWHKGQFATPDIATRIGFFGEIAIYELLNIWFPKVPYPNIEVSQKVQKYDFEWATPVGCKHEVKTTVAEPEAEQNYVRQSAVNNADVFWFLSTENAECGMMYLRGWCEKQYLLDHAMVKQGKGNWNNYVMQTEDLRSLNEFLKYRSSK